MSLLTVKDLKKTYFDPDPIPVIQSATLSVQPGERIAIVGPSGSGKSTLLHLLGGIEIPDSGEIQINGMQLTRENAPAFLNETIGFVFQSFHLIDEATVFENVVMPAKIARKRVAKGSEPFEQALSVLSFVGLEAKVHSPVKHLSGGEKQRVAIARALCNDPKIILADEPTGNLDPKHAHEIQELLLAIPRNEDKALIVVTHNEAFAQKCDRILVMDNGSVGL